MPPTNSNEIESIISTNKEEWNRLLFLLSNPEGHSLLWINYDTYIIKSALHTALSQYLPQFQPFDIHINSQTTSLYQVIQDNYHRVTPNTIIHIFGIEDAAKSEPFLHNLNFQRDSLFRNTPANIIIWGNFATTAILSHNTYDFWSWVSLSFDFTTPQELLTSRQKSLKNTIQLTEKDIHLPLKDGNERIRQLQHEWDEFLKTAPVSPSGKQQMVDAIIIAQALAKEYEDEGRYQEAITVLNTVLHLHPQFIEDEGRAYVLFNLCNLYRLAGKLKEAEECGIKALELKVKGNLKNDLNVVNIETNLALVYLDMKEFQKAKELLENAVHIYSQLGNSNYKSELLSAQANLASVYTQLNELDKAEVLLEKVLKESIEIYGSNHHSIATYLSNLSFIYWSLGDIYKAKELIENALYIDIVNYGENHPVTGIRYYNIAHIYKEIDNTVKATAYMQKAYDIFISHFHQNHPRVKAAIDFLNQQKIK